MSSCGVCGGKISNTLTPHGAICEDDVMAPTINDIIKIIKESDETNEG